MIQIRPSGELPQYVQRVAEETIKQTGKRIAIIERDILGMDYFVGVRNEGYQTIVYEHSLREHRDHFLVAGCEQFNRFYSSPENDQVIAVPRGRMRLPEDLEDEIRDLGGPLHELRVRRFSEHLYKHLMLQLIELPVQIRTERELRGKYQQHDLSQKAYLLDRANRAVSLAHDSLIHVPEHVVDASLVMNVAAAHEAARTAGKPQTVFRMNTRQSTQLAFVRGVLDVYKNEPGYSTDRKVIDCWADVLGFENWYEWLPLSAGP